MKHFSKKFLSIVLLLSTAAASAQPAIGTGSGSFETAVASTRSFDCNTGCNTGCDTGRTGNTGFGTTADCGDCRGGGEACSTTLFLPHPIGLNTAWLFDPYLYGCEGDVACFSFMIGYRHEETFKSQRIAECLFGRSTLHFQGSEVSGTRDPFALVGDNFGLAPSADTLIRFNPKIRNDVVDIWARWELCSMWECLEGAYFGLNATFGHTRWDLNFCDPGETPSTAAFSNFPAGYMSATDAVASNALESALSGDFTFGDMQEQWRYGRFNLVRDPVCCKDSDTKLANLDIWLGYDFLRCDSYHLGAFFVAEFPTGTRPSAEMVFSPILGNGHHYGVGGGLDAHVDFWCCDDQSLGLWFNGRATHLFKDTQWRTFDLRPSVGGGSGCLSRYLLLKEFARDGEYANRLINAVNWTTRRIQSSFGVQGDASIRLLYRNCGWAAALGYSIYGRSEEKLCHNCITGCDSSETRLVGIKGTSGVFARGVFGDTLSGDVIPLSATESTARISSFDAPVDNATPLIDIEGENFITWNSPVSPVSAQIIAEDSRVGGAVDGALAPVLLRCETDIDFRRGRIPSQISHKVFGTIDYAWEDCDWGNPFVGVGGEGEFASNCHKCTASQWGVWVRTGINY